MAGSSALRSAIVRAARAVCAHVIGGMSATFLLDTEQLYDSISSCHLVRFAGELGHPSLALALAGQAHTCEWRFPARGHYSEPLAGFFRSLIAGGTSSNSLSLCLL